MFLSTVYRAHGANDRFKQDKKCHLATSTCSEVIRVEAVSSTGTQCIAKNNVDKEGHTLFSSSRMSFSRLPPAAQSSCSSFFFSPRCSPPIEMQALIYRRVCCRSSLADRLLMRGAVPGAPWELCMDLRDEIIFRCQSCAVLINPVGEGLLLQSCYHGHPPFLSLFFFSLPLFFFCLMLTLPFSPEEKGSNQRPVIRAGG